MRPRVLLLALPATWLACFSQSSGGNPSVDFDASFDAAFEGGVDAEPIEGAAAETGSDATLDASPGVDAANDVALDVVPAPVRVIVGGALGFESGVSVIFADATGKAFFPTATNAVGLAATIVPAGGMVTVLLGTPGQPAPYTVMGLEPGTDVLVVDTGSLAAFPTLSPLIAGSPPDAGAVSYEGHAGACYGGGGSLPLPLQIGFGSAFEPCVGLGATGSAFGAAYPLLVEAIDGGGNPLAFAFAKDNPISMPDDAGNLDVALPAWSSSFVDQTLVVQNESDASFIPGVTYSEIASGILTPLPQLQAPLDDAGVSPGPLVHTHPGFADQVQAEAVLSPSSVNGPAGVAIIASAAPPTSSGSVTFDGTLFDSEPAFTAAQVSAPALTPGQPVVSWTLAGGDLHAMTGVVAKIYWNGLTAEGGTQTGVWTVVSPGTSATSLGTPALPGAAGAYVPVAGATFSGADLFAVDGRTAMPTYSSMLPIGDLFVSQVHNCYVGLPAVPPLPGKGDAAVSIYSTGGGC